MKFKLKFGKIKFANGSSYGTIRKETNVFNLRSSNALNADVLIIRIAGLPGSIFPSTRSFAQSSCFHD